MLIGLIALVVVFFSTAVMSYISMATPIGPWISPTLVLLSYLLLQIIRLQPTTSRMAGLVSLGSIGGILATACGFSFPTLYFLDPILFTSWLAAPWYFMTMLGSLAAISGWFGMWVANVMDSRLLQDKEIPFPVGHVIFNMINTVHQVQEIIKLVAGVIIYSLIAFLQCGLWPALCFLPRLVRTTQINMCSAFFLPSIALDLTIMPMLVAIGFIAGHMITVPLACGAIGKIMMLDPLRKIFFSHLNSTEFLLAFCSGMVLVGALSSFIHWPRSFVRWWRDVKYHNWKASYKNGMQLIKNHLFEFMLFMIAFILWGAYIGFSPMVQIYLLITAYLCVYNMILLGGQTGLAYLGRFATFVMIPAFLLFHLTNVQIVFIATFVEIAGGVAVDVMFGRKMAQLANVSSLYIKRMQYIGLILSCLCVGFIFWLLVTKFQLGSSTLSAYKAQARQLLLCAHHFDYKVLGLGAMAGLGLSHLRINPGMVLGGILMPLDISAGLIVGGLSSTLVMRKESWHSFWSGIFAANSLWILLSSLWS